MQFVDPRTEFGFYRVFDDENNRALLIDFLNAVLNLDQNHVIREVTRLDIFVAPKVRSLPWRLVEVKCFDARGVTYTVEMILTRENTTSKEDGILHLGEIYNLNLNAGLVVLSACETGLGQIAHGEGIIGLTRGFLYAGASNVLVSLWQVSDMTTSGLMVGFYDKMLAGMSKAEALAVAKRQMIRRDPGYAKPYYWSAFILIGR